MPVRTRPALSQTQRDRLFHEIIGVLRVFGLSLAWEDSDDTLQAFTDKHKKVLTPQAVEILAHLAREWDAPDR